MEIQAEKETLTILLENMKRPFGFLGAYYNQENVMGKSTKASSVLQTNEVLRNYYNNLDDALSHPSTKEINAIHQIDQVAVNLANRLGMNEVPWYKLTLYVTAIYTLIVLLSLFYRADFLNVFSH